MTILPFLLVFYEITTYLSTDMYLPALPQMMHDLNTTHYLAQLTLTTWFFGAASMQLILGPIADHYGRRPVLFCGGLMFIIAIITCALTHSITLFLIARFFQGCAVCSVVVAAYATVHELYEHKQAMYILALMGSMIVLAPSFGPLVGGLILHVAHWRYIFWLLAIWASTALLILFKYMPETNPNKKNIFNMRLLLKNYSAILTNKTFITHTLILCFVFSELIVWLTAGPFLIIDTFHYSPFMFGVFQAIVFGGNMLAARFVKYGIERIGSNQLITVGVFITLAASVLACLVSHFLIGFILAFTLYCIGSGLSYGPLNRTAIAACHQPMGLRMAVLSTLLSIAAVIASVSITAFYNGKIISLGIVILVLASCACVIKTKYVTEPVITS